MNIVIDNEDFNKDHIFLQEPVKNNIIDDSKFIRIIYSNNIFSVNTLCGYINLGGKNTSPAKFAKGNMKSTDTRK